MFYFGQGFVFCRLINKNVLEWFLLIICKERTLPDLQTLLVETTPHCAFDYEEKVGRCPILYFTKIYFNRLTKAATGGFL